MNSSPEFTFSRVNLPHSAVGVVLEKESEATTAVLLFTSTSQPSKVPRTSDARVSGVLRCDEAASSSLPTSSHRRQEVGSQPQPVCCQLPFIPPFSIFQNFVGVPSLQSSITCSVILYRLPSSPALYDHLSKVPRGGRYKWGVQDTTLMLSYASSQSQIHHVFLPLTLLLLFPCLVHPYPPPFVHSHP